MPNTQHHSSRGSVARFSETSYYLFCLMRAMTAKVLGNLKRRQRHVSTP